MDDFPVIVNNPDIRSLSNFIANTFPGRPLRELSYLLDYFLFGLDPWGYHFQNILWHALNSWLVYHVACRLKLSVHVARLSSLLFLVHPIHVEVVANSSHRKDSLALAFLMMAFLSFMRMFEQKSTSRRFYWLLATVILWVIAFFAKGNSLIFPLMALAYEYLLVPEERRIIVRWRRVVPLMYTVVPVVLIAWYVYVSTLPSFKIAIMGAFVKTENLTNFSIFAYVMMVLKSIAYMFFKLIWPVKLSMEYIYAVPTSLFDVWVISSLVMIAALCVIMWRHNKVSPQLLFLLIAGAVLWLPTANIMWPLSYFAADRYMYAPSAFLCILAVMAAEKAFRYGVRNHVIFWLIVISICSVMTWKQTGVWQNEMTLYTNMLKVSPRSLEAMIGLSSAYFHAKEYDSSARYARQAIERDFTDYRPYLTLGNISFVNGRTAEALNFFQESYSKNPLSPEVHNAIGSVYDEFGKFTQAVESFKMALKLRPDYFEAYTNLGVAYERMKNYEEAEVILNKALTANINYVPAWYNLGVVRYKRNDLSGARFAFYEAVNRDHFHADALSNLSIVCQQIGDASCVSDVAIRSNSLIINADGSRKNR